MTTLKLPKHTITNNGKFFHHVTEAANRGCKLSWDASYTFAYQTLDTNAFITEDLIKEIVAEGGDVTGYPMWFEMSVEDFNNKVTPAEFWQYLDMNVEESSNENGEPRMVKEVFTPKYKDVFNFIEPIYDVDAEGNTLQTYSKVKVLNSVNSEYISCSQVLAMVQ